MTEKKSYVSYEEIHDWVNRLSGEITSSLVSKPEVIIGIGGGGLLPARLFRTHLGIPMYAVFISFYEDDGDQHARPVIKQWLDATAMEHMQGKHILIVDEVNDTEATLDFCIEEVLATCKPAELSVAVLQDKVKEKAKSIRPDIHYYVGKYVPEDSWTVYPWSTTDGIAAQDEDLLNTFPLSMTTCSLF